MISSTQRHGHTIRENEWRKWGVCAGLDTSKQNLPASKRCEDEVRERYCPAAFPVFLDVRMTNERPRRCGS